MRAAETAPGVAAAAISTVNPLGGTTWTAPIAIEGNEVSGRNTSVAVNHRLITPRLFETMGIRLLQGRQFTPEDAAGAPGVAIVSRAMAQSTGPAPMPSGNVCATIVRGRWLEVVGVVSDVRDSTDALARKKRGTCPTLKTPPALPRRISC